MPAVLLTATSWSLARLHDQPHALIDPPSLAGAMAPNLTPIAPNAALLTWLEPAPVAEQTEPAPSQRLLRLRMSRFDGEQWSEPVTIVERDDFFANWADLPSIAQAGDGSLIAHWLQKSGPGTYAYDVMLARSTDDGRTWKALGPLHDDRTQTEHGFVSLVPEGDDGIRAFWLDGREMEGDEGDQSNEDGHGSGNMTLRTATIRGEEIGPSELLDMRVCECCNTSAAITEHGPVIVYRDRSEQDTRDISIVRRIGDRWTDPRPVHDDGWQISACPVNGPAIVARDNFVAVAWFTAANFKPRVLLKMSADGGATFGPAVTIDDADPIGRVAITLEKDQFGRGGGGAVVCWVAAGDEPNAASIKMTRVRAGQLPTPRVTVADTTTGRGSGFPRIAAVGEQFLIVWTEPGRPSRLRAALIEND